MTGCIPFSGCDDATALSNIRDGEKPQRPSEGIADPVWLFLEKCWRRTPRERPSAALLYHTFSKLRPVPKPAEELPRILKLQVQGIKLPFTGTKKQQFSVHFKYRSRTHTIKLPTEATTGDEYTLFAFRSHLPSPLSLSVGQEISRSLVDRNQQRGSRTIGLLGGGLPNTHKHIQERHCLCDGEILRESVAGVKLPTWLIIHV